MNYIKLLSAAGRASPSHLTPRPRATRTSGQHCTASVSRKCVQGGRAAGTHLPTATDKGHNVRGFLWTETLQSQEMVKLALLFVHLHHDAGQN